MLSEWMGGQKYTFWKISLDDLDLISTFPSVENAFWVYPNKLLENCNWWPWPHEMETKTCELQACQGKRMLEHVLDLLIKWKSYLL